MAVGTSVDNRVLTTTLSRYSKQISNEIARNDGIIGVFGSRGAIKVTGGATAIETLDADENPNFDFRSMYSDIPTARADTRKQAEYGWATMSGAVAINKIEEAMNAGETKIYDLVEAEITNAKRTVIRQLADALRQSSPGANDPESIQTIMPATATGSQTTTTGGLSRSTNTFWRSQYSATACDTSAVGGYEVFSAFIHQSCAKGTSKQDRPDFGLLSGTMYAGFSSQGENVRRFTSDATVLKLGFDNIIVEGATLIADPAIASIGSGYCYLMNTNYLGLQVLRTDGMENIGDKPQTLPISVGSFQDAYNSLHKVSLLYVTMALTCSSLQRQGLMSGLA